MAPGIDGTKTANRTWSLTNGGVTFSGYDAKFQFVNGDLCCASYLVGDLEAGVAVVVDPGFAIEQYLDAAGESGVRIERQAGGGVSLDRSGDRFAHQELDLVRGRPVFTAAQRRR